MKSTKATTGQLNKIFKGLKEKDVLFSENNLKDITSDEADNLIEELAWDVWN